MKLIITAGGTSERIDDVRSITNTSTGRLGHAIGEAMLRMYGKELETLYYLHGMRAQPLQGESVKNIQIEGVRDLETQIRRLLSEEQIGGVVHAMAVSDYMVKEVTTLGQIKSGAPEKLEGNKISSNIEDLTIVLQRAPKVISIIKSLQPKTVLVGFKLLSHVSREELITVAHELLKKNECSYVLANDLSEIGGGRHRGYLVHRDKSYDTMETNEEIAEMIARRVREEMD